MLYLAVKTGLKAVKCDSCLHGGQPSVFRRQHLMVIDATKEKTRG